MQKRLEALDLNLILALFWLLTERNVTRAADRLGLSQPATSRALGRLRDIYDDPILVKSGREMNPTPLAHSLLPPVTKAVKEMRSVFSMTEAFDPKHASGRFRVGCKDSIAMRIVAAWERSVRPKAPNITLEIVDLTVECARDLVSGALDIAILPLNVDMDIPPSVDMSQFVIKPLFTDPWVTLVASTHPLAKQKLSIQEFTAYDHIIVNPDNGPEKSNIDQMLSERGLSRQIAYRTQSFLLSLPILLGTNCILTTSESLLGCGIIGVKRLGCPLPLDPLQFSVGWHPNWTNDARHKWVRSQLLPVLAENDPQCLCHLDDLIDAA